MRSSNLFRKTMAFLLLCAVCCVLSGWSGPQDHNSPRERDESYHWYEAVFLDKQAVEKVFRMASDDYPKFEHTPMRYHVTTEFKPEPGNEALYGSPVTVHIIGYTSGTVQDIENGISSDNEGLLVELSSEVEGMQALIDSCDNTWHITGSYTTAAKYTGLLDFSDVVPVDVTLEGVFGMGANDGTFTLEPPQ